MVLPAVQILVPSRGKYINFSNPFNARQWLRLLRHHERYGLTFHPSLELQKSPLGFSFKTNSLGFRGPAAKSGDNVLMGTSFAMGLSVDNGHNWYEQLLDEELWLNIGMPVGPENHESAIEDLYAGAGKTLLYLYHPNIWKTATGFSRARTSGKSIFELLGWKSDLGSAIKAYPKWVAKELVKSLSGASLYRRWDGVPFFFNCRYNWLAVESGQPFVQEQIKVLNRIFGKFDRVVVIRTPIKEERVPDVLCTPMLKQLRTQYDFYWDQLQSEAVHSAITFYSLSDQNFSREHFLPFDTHWSSDGNRLFTKAARAILLQEGTTGVL